MMNHAPFIAMMSAMPINYGVQNTPRLLAVACRCHVFNTKEAN
ncbi:MAG: hypothetical protein ACNYPH_07595 [Gammaproteobacteria bacterium WSBS_2016_MAG_OTU1]